MSPARARPHTGRASQVRAPKEPPRPGVLSMMEACGVVAVLRAPTAKRFPAIAETLIESGVTTIEVTLTSADAVEAIAALRQQYRLDGSVLVGAGSVLTAADAESCIEAGAQFLVAPVAAPDVVASAKMAHLTVVAGALTPTEIFAAHSGGADAVKVFPAFVMGPAFLRAVHGPLPGVPLIPTGGIGVDDAGAWVAAGAAAVGLGGSLLGDSCTADRLDADALRLRARRAVDAVARERQ